MLAIQAVRGLPRLRAPGIVPCIKQGSSLVSSWCDHALTVSNSSLFTPALLRTHICFLCCPRSPQNLSQSFHLKGVTTCFLILSESPAFTASFTLSSDANVSTLEVKASERSNDKVLLFDYFSDREIPFSKISSQVAWLEHRLDTDDIFGPVVVGNVGDNRVSSCRPHASETQQLADATPICYLCWVALGQPSTVNGPICNTP